MYLTIRTSFALRDVIEWLDERSQLSRDRFGIIALGRRPMTNLGQAAEPGRLPLGELPRPRLDPLDRLAQAGLSRQHRDDLAIAHALGGHRAHGALGRLQATDFLDEAGVEHNLDTAVDPVVEFGAR